MTETELAAIEARANAATKGPWGLLPEGVSRKPPNRCPTVFRADTDLRYIALCRDVNEWNQGGPTDNLANATFIAHAREDIPALVAEVRRLREIVSKLPRDAMGKPIAPDMVVYYLSSSGVQQATAWKVLGYGVETMGGHTLPATGGVVSLLYVDRADAERAMREVEAQAEMEAK